MLSVKGDKLRTGVANVIFNFEDAITVTVSLFNLDVLTESWRTPHIEDWVVFQAKASHYASDDPHHEGDKTTTQFEVAELTELRTKRLWHHPHVASIDSIQSTVGIFYNNASNAGYLVDDPEYNSEGHYHLADEVRYRVLVPGDKEKARADAQQRLTELCAEEVI